MQSTVAPEENSEVPMQSTVAPEENSVMLTLNPRISTPPPAAAPAITITTIAKSERRRGRDTFFSAAVDVIFNPIASLT
jgi:hypothetical protein